MIDMAASIVSDAAVATGVDSALTQEVRHHPSASGSGRHSKDGQRALEGQSVQSPEGGRDKPAQLCRDC